MTRVPFPLLVALLFAAAALAPAASRAQDVPPVSGPYCEESPYGCPGGGGGGDEENWPVPIPGPNAPFDPSRPFVGATCVNLHQYNEKCFHETGGQSVARLSRKVSSTFVKGLTEDALKMKFPSSCRGPRSTSSSPSSRSR